MPKTSFSHYTCMDVLQTGPGMSTSTITGNPLQYNIPDLCTDQPHPTCGVESSSSSSYGGESSSSGDDISSSGGSSGSNGSSGSDGGITNICRATSDELVPIMADLIIDCTTGTGAGNTHTYNIEYMPIESPSAPFCITGMYKYDSSGYLVPGSCNCRYSCDPVCYSVLPSFPFLLNGYIYVGTALDPLSAPMICSNGSPGSSYVVGFVRPSGDDCITYLTMNLATRPADYYKRHSSLCISIFSGFGGSSGSSGSSSSHGDVGFSSSAAYGGFFPSSGSGGGSASSAENSSSSEVISSSSSDSGVCQSHPLPSVPRNPLNACFAKNGRCYKCNPARGSECGNDWLWIYNFVPDNVGWWYTEISCDGFSSSSSQETSGICKENKRGPDAVYTAGDCFSSGLDNMAQGKCYSLNPDRGTQYGWINNNAQDGWWWREVACGGGSNKCQDSPFLQKKSILEKDSEYAREDASYEVWKNKTQAHPETRRYLFAPKKNIVLSAGKEGYSEKGLLKTLPDGKECGKIGKDYGIVLDNGQCKGGNTCYWFDVDYYYKEKPITIIGNDNCICGDDSLIRIEGSFSYKLNLTINEIYYVRKGYVFLDGYKTTENDVSAIRNHELKHKQDNASIIKGSGSIPIDTTICKGNLLTFRKEIKEKLHSDIKFEYDAKAKTASDTFHQNCYLEGFCE